MEQKEIDRIYKKVRDAIDQFGLIEEGDKILVGLSGGKDSLAMLDFLSRKRQAPYPKFDMVAVHVSMSNIPYQSDIEYLRAYANALQVEFVHDITSFDPTTDTRNTPCFLCSWTRRKRMFALAKELGCNKMALGHHLDDMIQTLLMNMTFQGSFSTMPPLLKMDKFDMCIIRPLSLVEEKDLIQYALHKGYKKQPHNCPYETDSNRTSIREVLDKMIQLNPHAKSSLLRSMMNVQDNYLPKSVK
ncbi:MAG: tRNA 2-thiocytidine(32) synthetase TtcA [Paludibacteraceae bacterium]|nr:tRNA 2-thiocytidine(32) synthetase TtcA [Paludibacteraceae bacterium]MEE3484725.1 ATP-binding protein [Bacteroidales bacterium]